MPNVFVSHSSKNRGFVLSQLLPALEAGGAVAWCSARDLREGSNWERQIRAALVRSDWFLVVLSLHAQRSNWVQAETHWAVEHMPGRVVPLLLDDCKPEDIHLLLGTLHFIDLRLDVDRGLAELTEHLSSVPTGGKSTNLVGADQETLLRTTIARRPRCIGVTIRIRGADYGLIERRVQIVNRVIIGRAPDAGLRLADASVSRRHARLDVVSADPEVTLTVTDLGSSNGTFVNGKLASLPTRVEPDDILLLGDVELCVLDCSKGPGVPHS